MFTRIMLIALVLALTGCTTIRTVDLSESPATYTITLTNGRQLDVNDLQVADDSTSWTEPGTRRQRTVPSSHIQTIMYDAESGIRIGATPRSFDPGIRPSFGRLFAEINEGGAHKAATVTLSNDRRVRARSLQVTPDSTSWLDPETGRFESVATAKIREIRFVRHGKGAGAGFSIGFFGGAAVGSILGASAPRCEGFCLVSEGEFAVFSAVAVGAIGGLVGTLVGAATGSKDIYRFNDPARVSQVASDDARQD